MIGIVRALLAEQLKLRRTLALWLAPLAPLVIVALQVAIVVERPDYYRAMDVGDPWLEFGGQIVFLWTVLMLPLFITLETALLGQLEHANQQWKHLFALPIPRGAVYAAKHVGGLAIIGLSMIALYIYLPVSGWALEAVFPGLGLDRPVPWGTFFQYMAAAYLASGLIIAIHTWVALRWHSFVVASAAGIAAMVVAVVVMQSDWSTWYPWTLAGLAVFGLEEGSDVLPQILAGSLGGLAFAVLGMWDVTRRDVT